MVADTVADIGYLGSLRGSDSSRNTFVFKVSTSGGTGIRTPDPLHAMQVLYQLSYTPKGPTMLTLAGRPISWLGQYCF
jgi:hypothetical protein